MLKIISLLFSLVIFTVIGWSQTDVDTSIDQSTVWSKIGNPYTINQSITIYPAATLKIEAGVEIIFTSSARMLVYGSIIASGTEQDKIKFLGIDLNTSSLEHECLTLKDNGQVQLDHCDITNTYYFLVADKKSNVISIDNSSFLNNRSALFGSEYNEALISNTIFSNNLNSAIARMNVTIDKCSFISSGKALDKITGKVYNSTFRNNNFSAIYNSFAITLLNNQFSENNTAIDLLVDSKPISIRNNDIKNNQTGIRLDGTESLDFQMNGNTICSSIKNIINNTDFNYNVSENCWCITDSIEIAKKVTNVKNKGGVTFIPLNISCRPCAANAGEDIEVCSGIAYKLGAKFDTIGFSFKWTSLDGIDTIPFPHPEVTLINNSASDIIQKYILNASTIFRQCTADTVAITIHNSTYRKCRICVANAGSDIQICTATDTIIGVNADTTFSLFSWYPTEGLSNPLAATPTLTSINETNSEIDKQFILTVTDKDSVCFKSDTINITVHPKYDIRCNSLPPIHIYNVITINGDEKNKYFYINNINLYPENEVTIFNRWGMVVFHKNSYQNDWKGDELPEGIYYYSVKSSSNEQNINGELLIKK